MAELFESNFFGLYWKYVFAGILVYLTARFLYNVLSFKQTYEKFGTGEDSDDNDGNEGEFETPDQLLEKQTIAPEGDIEEFDSEEDVPALPPDLEHVPLVYEKLATEESLQRSEEYCKFMNMRRTIRHFSTEDIPIKVMQNIIKTAGTAPSGAHTEPWTYVLVKSPEIKQQIREIIEEQEEINYKQRMGKTWTTDLKPLRTSWVKEYLTEAPYLILVFKQTHSFKSGGQKKLHYYSEQSVALSAGILLAAIHYAGLYALTSTPLNCGPALRTLLGRPSNEKLTLLLPVGYPKEGCLVPDLNRKPLEDILVEI